MGEGCATSMMLNGWNRALTVCRERRRAGVLQFTRNRCWRKDCQTLGGTMQNVMPKPEKISVIVTLCDINLERAEAN